MVKQSRSIQQVFFAVDFPEDDALFARIACQEFGDMRQVHHRQSERNLSRLGDIVWDAMTVRAYRFDIPR